MLPEQPPSITDRFLNLIGLSKKPDSVEADKIHDATKNRFQTIVHDVRNFVGRKVSQIKAPKQEHIDEIRDAILPSPGDKKTPLEKIQILNYTLREVLNADQSTLEVVKYLSANLERVAPSAINDIVKELGNLKVQYNKLMTKQDAPKLQEVMEKLELLESELSEAFNQFTQIRTAICKMPDQENGTIKQIFTEIHSHLSKVMKQPSDGLNESVEFPAAPTNSLKAAKLIISKKAYRRKIPEALGYIFKGLGSACKATWERHVLKLPSAEDPALVLSDTKAKVVNCFSALSPVFARQMFGADLLAGARNVVTIREIAENRDIITARYLQQKVDDLKQINLLMTYVPNLELELMPTVHGSDGLCVGLSAELCRELFDLQAQGRPLDGDLYKLIAIRIATHGAPSAAYANQALYEAFKSSSNFKKEDLEALIVVQQKAALDPANGRGIYKADWNVVKECYDYIVNGDAITVEGSLVEAIQKVKREHRELFSMTQSREGYISDTKTFKEKVLDALAEMSDRPDIERAKNELEWVLGNLELRTIFNYCNHDINSPFVTNVNIDLLDIRNAPSVEGMLSCVGNAVIRDNLHYMINTDRHFLEQQQMARARGLDLSRLEGVLGFSYGDRSDSDVLDRMDDLADGCYLMSIDLKKGGHTMHFFKHGDERYLLDPNFGLIDCSGGRQKEQITKLLKGLELFYPPTKLQGPNSDGTSHNITLLKVDPADEVAHPDLLAGFDPDNYRIDENGRVVLRGDDGLLPE